VWGIGKLLAEKMVCVRRGREGEGDSSPRSLPNGKDKRGDGDRGSTV